MLISDDLFASRFRIKAFCSVSLHKGERGRQPVQYIYSYIPLTMYVKIRDPVRLEL